MTSFNSLKYLVKTKLENKEQQLLGKEDELENEFERKICIKCIGTKKQEKRDCLLLNGGTLPSCDNMDNYVHRRTKKEKEKLFHSIMRLQVEQDVEEAYQSLPFD